MGKVIPYSDLARQHQLNFLAHKRREYREREDYLAGLRKLLFQVEGQMRQAELRQLQVFQDLAENLKLSLQFPNMGDRLALEEFFATNPVLLVLRDFLGERLSAEECLQRLEQLRREPAAPEGA